MDVREKLIEILKQAPFEGKVLDEWWWEEKIKRIADHLIRNGVTVQEWVSVEDRLPEESGYYLVFTDVGRNEVLSYSKKYQAFNAFDDAYSEENVVPVTHWMPLPLAPEDMK